MSKDLQPADYSFDGVDIFLDVEKTDEKCFKLTDQVLKAMGNLVGVGLSNREIADAFKLPESVLAKMIENIPEVKASFKEHKAKVKGSVLKGLAQAGINGNPLAANAWLMLKGGETSPHLQKALSADNVETLEADEPTAEKRLKMIVHLNRLLVKGGVLSKEGKFELGEKEKEEAERIQNNKKHILRKIGVKEQK